jgi:hypothetical protein
MLGVRAKHATGVRPTHEYPESPRSGVRLRPEPGYLSTIYDVTPAPYPKSPRGQIGQKHDAKKVRNTSPHPSPSVGGADG